jgi:hypothetical protein
MKSKDPKHLSAKQFYEIVLNKKIKLPSDIYIYGRNYKDITKIFVWLETIQTYEKFTDFNVAHPQWCLNIEEMNFTEKELLSLISLWNLWKRNPEKISYKA